MGMLFLLKVSYGFAGWLASEHLRFTPEGQKAALEVSWANSFRLPYSILIESRWKVLPELTGPIP
jgi:hypothetical protein